ncbi:hypothetical protein ABEV34_04650 [Methylorubrum rhodesianum]|uniref:hypothetical protein n=1 Tax=Methylorubrum rhodesianum TaxID=29427 RepID=UPI003D2C1C8D
MTEEDFDIENAGLNVVNAPEIDASGVSLTMPANVLDRIVDWAACRVEEQMRIRADRLVRERVDGIVNEAFDRAVGEIADKAISDFLNKPRQKTNTWGEPMPGPSTTMADLIPAKVEAWLSDTVSKSDGSRLEGYQRSSGITRLEFILNKHVRDELAAETKAAASKVTEEAKKVVSASVGRFIADQLVPQIDIERRR